jgi:hypothetical protein
MIKVRLVKDIPSPWNERKTLPRGREIVVTKELGKKMIENKEAQPVPDNELKELREKIEVRNKDTKIK